jgi:hypothetical protein
VTAARAPVPARRKGRITREDRGRFLDALSSAWSVTAAAEQAGRSRQRFYELREQNETFAQEWADAWERGSDLIRDEIRRRAVDGVEEPVFQKGELVGHKRVRSDRLLELEAKRRDPDYRDKVPESTQPLAIVIQEVRLEPDQAKPELPPIDGVATLKPGLRALPEETSR